MPPEALPRYTCTYSPPKAVLLSCISSYSGNSHQERIESPKAARGHATHIDDIVLNVTKFRIQILCSLRYQ